jgi:hypothetical protein
MESGAQKRFAALPDIDSESGKHLMLPFDADLSIGRI